MNVASSKSLNSFAYSKKESMSKKWRRIIMLIYQWFFTNKQLISVLKRILSMRELQAHYLSYVFALIPSEIPLILFCKTAILFLICETTLWRRSWRDINFKGSGKGEDKLTKYDWGNREVLFKHKKRTFKSSIEPPYSTLLI